MFFIVEEVYSCKKVKKLLIDGTCLGVQRGGVAQYPNLSQLSEVPNLNIRCVVMNGSVNDLPNMQTLNMWRERPLG